MNIDPEGYFKSEEHNKILIIGKIVEKYQLYEINNANKHFKAIKDYFQFYNKFAVAEIIFNIIKINRAQSREIVIYVTGHDLASIILENIDYITEKHLNMLHTILLRKGSYDDLPKAFMFINKLANQRKLKDINRAAIISFIEACKDSLQYTDASYIDVPKSLVEQLPVNIKNKDSIVIDLDGDYVSCVVTIAGMKNQNCFVKVKLISPRAIVSTLDICHEGITMFSASYGKGIYYHTCVGTTFHLRGGSAKMIIKKVIPLDGSDYTLYPGCFVLTPLR